MPATDDLASTSAGRSPIINTAAATDLSIVGILNVALERRRLIASYSIAVALLVIIILVFLPRTYSTTSSLIPQRSSSTSLAGIAAQFGLTVPGADPSQSPAFYSDLVTTREIIGAVVDSRYADPRPDGHDSVTLVDILGKGPNTVALQRELAIRKLRRATTVDVSLKSGTVTITVEGEYPALTTAVNQKILDFLNNFNLHKRQTQAAFERRFVERRLGEVREELRAAEDRVQGFLQANKEYSKSPSLVFDHDRLERDLSMQQQVYTSLTQAYEQAKIDEIKDSPLITVIEEPVVPVAPNPRGLLQKGFLALVAGFLLGAGIAFAQYAVRYGRAGNTDDLARLRLLIGETVGGILHPWRKVRTPHEG